MNRQLKIRYALIVAALVIVSLTTWFAMFEPSPYIFVFAGAGLLVSIGITIYKTRAGHFNK
jgi:hypothetical protein